MTQPPPTSSVSARSVTYTSLVLFAICGLMFALALLECSTANDQGMGCMQSLQPIVDQLIIWYRYPRDYYLQFFQVIFIAVWAILGCTALWSLLLRRFTSTRLVVVVALATIGEYLVLQRHQTVGSMVTLVTPLVIALLSIGFPPATDERNSSQHRINLLESSGLLLMWALLLMTQFFLLNHIPYSWDTEFCPFRFYYWQSWSGLLLHESGYHPQTSAGLSWNLIMFLLGHVDEPDNYYLYIRFLSSGLAALKFFLLFFLMRWLCGTFAAFLSVTILGFGPPENWWSREPFLHHLPGLVAIPLLWSWIAAWRNPTWIRFAMLGVTMGIIRFVYPSGMFLAFGPPIFFSILLIFRRQEWLRHAACMLPMLPGLLFWLTWRTIARGLQRGDWTLVHPLEVPGQYAPRSFGARLDTIWENLIDTFSSIFLYQVNPTHWTVPLVLPPVRCITSIVVVLLLCAVARMLRWRSGQLGLILAISLFLTLFPGLMTEVAARRAGGAFLILTIIAAREAHYLTHLLRDCGSRWIASLTRLAVPIAACLYLTWIGTAIHFSGVGGTPPQVVRGRMMRQEIQDDALVVFLSGVPNCDTFYSVYNDLKARNCKTGWVAADFEGSPDTQQLIEAPAIRPNSWVYQLTDMRQCLPEHQTRDWKKIIFMISETSNSERLIETLKNRYPLSPHRLKTERNPFGDSYKVFTLELNR